MATASQEGLLGVEISDKMLPEAIISSVSAGLMMCNTEARCVGVSAIPSGDPGLVTGMIGVHGKVSGFTTINVSERLAVKMVGGLLMEEFSEFNNQVVDGAGEITNIIVGGIKSQLAGSNWSFTHMTVPSVIIGHGYKIAYAKGLEFVCVTFEVDNPEAIMLDDKLLHVSISLLKL